MKRCLGLLAIASVIGIALLAMGGYSPWDVGQELAFGWWRFLSRTGPHARLDVANTATAVICLTLFALGLHAFIRWTTTAVARDDVGANAAALSWSLRHTAATVAIIIIMFVAGMAFVGIVHQTAWIASSPEPWATGNISMPQNQTSATNLSTQGKYLADIYGGHPNDLHEYYARRFTRKAAFSWQTYLLGFSTYSYALRYEFKLDDQAPWDDSVNAITFKGIVPEYINPDITVLRDEHGYALSHYAGNVHVLGRDERLDVRRLANGTSNTIACGDVAAAFKPWGDPANLRDPLLGLNRSNEGFSSPAGGGARFAMLDGSVRFISGDIDPRVLRALSGVDEAPLQPVAE